MKNYRISIEETVVDEFEITAKNSKEALDKKRYGCLKSDSNP